MRPTSLLPDQQKFHQHLRELACGAIRIVLEGVMRQELDALIGLERELLSPRHMWSRPTPGIHKGPSTPTPNPAPCHYISKDHPHKDVRESRINGVIARHSRLCMCKRLWGYYITSLSAWMILLGSLPEKAFDLRLRDTVVASQKPS